MFALLATQFFIAFIWKKQTFLLYLLKALLYLVLFYFSNCFVYFPNGRGIHKPRSDILQSFGPTSTNGHITTTATFFGPGGWAHSDLILFQPLLTATSPHGGKDHVKHVPDFVSCYCPSKFLYSPFPLVFQARLLSLLSPCHILSGCRKMCGVSHCQSLEMAP